MSEHTQAELSEDLDELCDVQSVIRFNGTTGDLTAALFKERE